MNVREHIRQHGIKYLIAVVAVALVVVTLVGRELRYVEVDNVPGARPDGATKVLFVGNSHTAFFDLPRMVQRMQPADERIWFDVVASGGRDLRWHIENSDIEDQIREGDFDVVVLQTLPNEPHDTPEAFLRDIDRLGRAARETGKRTIFWVPWPHPDEVGPHLTPAMERILVTTERVNIEQTRIGPAFVAAHQDGAPVFLPDGIHATLGGTFLSATMLCEAVYDVSLQQCFGWAPENVDTVVVARIRDGLAARDDRRKPAVKTEH